MAYTTPDAVRLVLTADGNPADLSTAASLDDTTLTPICQTASDEIDARLATRYPVPFPVAPNIVADIAADIAAYLATLTFRKGQPVDTTDPVWLRYQRSLNLLVAVQTGAAALPGYNAQAAPAGQTVVTNPTPGPLFTPEDFDLVRQPAGSEWGVRRWWGA